MRHDPEVEELEVRLMLEAIHARYGYDLRDYARPSMRRRMLAALARSEAANLGDLRKSMGVYDSSGDQLWVDHYGGEYGRDIEPTAEWAFAVGLESPSGA